MQRKDFAKHIQAGPMLLDGATGTWLQAHGMPTGVCPETWALAHHALLYDLHHAYFRAGAHIAVTCTFGANETKLAHYGIGPERVEALNRDLARLAVAARDAAQSAPEATTGPLLVSGNIGPTGRFLQPAGDLAADDLVAIYRRQVRGLLAGGVDLFSIETMMDLGQMRAALRAVRAECALPVVATLTFDATGKTLSGDDPAAAAIALAAAGADAFGANCSTGPTDMGRLLATIPDPAPLPLVCKPNAGMPRVEDGQTFFDMDPQTFSAQLLPFVRTGTCRLVGGCCGTTPEHIAVLARAIRALPALPVPTQDSRQVAYIASARRVAAAPPAATLALLPVGDATQLQDLVMDAMEDAPDVIGLDFAAWDRQADLPALAEAMGWVQLACDTPLVFRSDDAHVLRTLVTSYAGRAGIITNLTTDFEGALRLA